MKFRNPFYYPKQSCKIAPNPEYQKVGFGIITADDVRNITSLSDEEKKYHRDCILNMEFESILSRIINSKRNGDNKAIMSNAGLSDEEYEFMKNKLTELGYILSDESKFDGSISKYATIYINW